MLGETAVSDYGSKKAAASNGGEDGTPQLRRESEGTMLAFTDVSR